MPQETFILRRPMSATHLSWVIKTKNQRLAQAFELASFISRGFWERECGFAAIFGAKSLVLRSEDVFIYVEMAKAEIDNYPIIRAL